MDKVMEAPSYLPQNDQIPKCPSSFSPISGGGNVSYSGRTTSEKG